MQEITNYVIEFFFVHAGYLPHDPPVFLLSTISLLGSISTQGRQRWGE